MRVHTITRVAAQVAEEFSAQVQVDSACAERVEIFLTVPIEVLKERETDCFAQQMVRHKLDSAPALTLEAEVRYLPEMSSNKAFPYQLFLASEHGANDLCDRTATAFVLRLASLFEGKSR